MKKLFIISALFIGYSVSGMSQSTTQTTEQVYVISKTATIDTSINVYTFRSMSGQVYESLPVAAKLHVGEAMLAKEVKTGAMDDIPAGKTIVENERTGLLFLKGK